MKGSSKSLLAVKAEASRSTSDSSRTGGRAATPGACTHEEALVSLVRLLARQAAQEFVVEAPPPDSQEQPEPDDRR
jgi:hypothetical protein